MEKIVKVGKKSVRLDNNITWALIYKNQFGKDIVPTLMPAIAAAFDVISGLFNTGEDMNGKIDIYDVLKKVDGTYFLDAVIHLGGLELEDMIDLTWALAKTADDDIPEPFTWAKELGDFPLDEIAPAVFSLIAKGVVSSKNLKRLKDLKTKLQPSSSTTSFSPQQSED